MADLKKEDVSIIRHKYVSVGNMHADDGYQRPANLARVRKIAKEWDDMLMSPILLSKRADGTYWVMDGNHTRLAAREKFGADHELPCIVYENLTPQQEAEVFTRKNSSQKKPSYNQMLKAKLSAGDPFTTHYFRSLDAAGLWYTLGAQTRGQFRAHNALMKVYKSTANNPDLFTRAVKAGVEAAAGRNEWFQAGIFPGFCSLIIKHPDINDSRLVSLAIRTPTGVIGEKAKAYSKTISGSGDDATKHYRYAFMDLYNGKKKKGRIAEEI